jgi:hypothetical protein
MVSTLSWLDHDSAAAERSMRMLSLFKEREARDELGIGGMRDAIADQLFPGTSTIQTRLRYVFFIPWLFGQIEEKNTTSAAYPSAANLAENRLLAALLDSVPEAETGIIGREAGSELKRLPSSVYWAALGSWGMRNTDETRQQYFAQSDRRRTLRAARRRRDDGVMHDGDVAARAWNMRVLKLCPDAFPIGTDMALTRGEAELLLDRWSESHKDSLLAWLAKRSTQLKVLPEVDRIWNHPQIFEFPDWIQELIIDGRRLDALTRGAALLYNLQLAQLDDREQVIDDYRAKLVQWVDEELPDCADWQLEGFWPRVLDKGHTITEKTQRFIHTWRDLAIAGCAVGDGSSMARQLIAQREQDLKGARSRFTNPAARKQWGGAAGTSPLTYRWPIASAFLQEWHAGWWQQ